MNASFRTALATLFGSVALLVAPAAFAVGEPCFNDTDCPGGGGDVCGGDVCKWGPTHAMPDGDKIYICVAAGTDAKGKDGWCTAANGDANCKCRAQGAKCSGVYCTFTKDPPAGAGGSGSGAGGSPATAGTTSAAGTTSTAGTAPKPAAEEESSGCSVGVPGGANTGVAVALGLLGLGAVFARRRR